MINLQFQPQEEHNIHFENRISSLESTMRNTDSKNG